MAILFQLTRILSFITERERQANIVKCPEGSCVIILVTGSDINTLISSFSLWRSSWSSGRGFLLCAFRTCSLLFSSLIFFSHWSQVYLKRALKPVKSLALQTELQNRPTRSFNTHALSFRWFGEATQKSVPVLCRLTWREMWDIIPGMDWFGSISLHLSDLLYHFWTCPYHIKEATVRIEFLASTSSVCTPIAELVRAHSHSPLVYLFWVTPLASSDAWLWPDLQPPSLPAAFCLKDFGVCKEFSSCICSVSSRMLRTPQNKTHTPCPQHRHSDQLTDIYYRLSKTAVLSVFSAHHRLEGCQE